MRRETFTRRTVRCRLAFALALGLVAFGLFALGLADGARAQSIQCAIGKPQQVAELMFGRKIGGRIAVSEAAWTRFVDREITPRFPDGLSIVDARGQWRDQAHKTIVHEPSKLVQIVLPGRPEDGRRLAEIAAAYKKKFHQQSVAVIVRPACVAF
jgi:hypothetical protein